MRSPWLLLAACGDLSLALPAAPPPPVIELAVSDAMPGQLLTLTVWGAQPAETVVFGWGAQAGPGPCPPSLGGACLGIPGVRSLGQQVADDHGRAVMTVGVPLQASPGSQVYVQAAVARGAASQVSQVASVAVTRLGSTGVMGRRALVGESIDAAWAARSGPVSIDLVDPQGAGWPVTAGQPAVGRYAWQLPLELDPGLWSWRVRAMGDAAMRPGVNVAALVSFRWNGAREVMSRVDPSGTSVWDFGTVGDLATWSGQVAYDPAAARLYVEGNDAAGAGHLYALDALDGSLLASIPWQPLLGLRVANDGELRGCRWDGSRELLVRAAPSTGARVDLGQVGDLQTWGGVTLYDPGTDTMYVVGHGVSRPWIYALDATTGALLGVTPIASSYAGLQLDALRGRLIGFRWSGSVEEMVGIDLASGAERVIGTVGDLQTWGGQAVLDDRNDRVLVWGNGRAGAKVWILDLSTGRVAYEAAAAGVQAVTLTW